MQYGILTFEEPKPDTSRQILHVDGCFLCIG